MPSIQGSSRILNTSGTNSLTGPIGHIGPTGPTGGTGSTGPVGVDGSIGIGIISAVTGASGGIGGSYGGNWITFYLTDGTTIGVSGAKGDTGASDSQDFEIINAVQGPEYGQIYHSKNGITAYFKSLTVSGKDISIGGTSDYTIILDGITYEQARLGNTGELLYNFSGASAHGALNTFWSGDQLTARILQHRETSGSNNLMENPENTSPIAGTAAVDGTSVIFEYLVDDDGMTATSVGIHLGKTGDDDVIYRFAGVTHGVIYDVGSRLGSCCFCEKDIDIYSSRTGCADYVSQNYCESIGGIFDNEPCLYRPEGPNCYVQGACCVNGVCVETSREKCEDTYGGFFASNMTCEDVQDLGSSTDDDLDNGCPKPCFARGACCINKFCYNYSEYECSFFSNSTWKDAPCDEVNCCLEIDTGACCLDEMCYETNPLLCSLMTASDGFSKGLFWGIGSSCAGPYRNTGVYAPHDCGLYEDGTVIGPINADGKCVDDLSDPPCLGCVGWTQEMSSDAGLNICASDSIGYCDDNYEENSLPAPQCCACSCGTCNTNVSDCIGSCCAERMDGNWDCSLLNSDDCTALKNSAEYENVCWGGCNTSCELADGTPRCETGIGCCKASSDIMFLVDISASMNQPLEDGILKIDATCDAVLILSDETQPQRDKLGCAWFNQWGGIQQQLTYNRDQFESKINSLRNQVDGGTCSTQGLQEVLNELTSERARQGTAQPVLVMLGDGSQEETCDADSLIIADQLKAMGVLIYTIQLGEFDNNFHEISSGEEYSYQVNSSGDLNSAYLQIYSSICDNSEYEQDETAQSCGSILLADGTCWECCCHSDFPEDLGCCCTDGVPQSWGGMTEGSCLLGGGTYTPLSCTDQAEADPNWCEATGSLGACCYDEESCIDTSYEICGNYFKGNFQGFGTDCNTTQCQSTTPGICYFHSYDANDYNCCAPIDGSETAPCCCHSTGSKYKTCHDDGICSYEDCESWLEAYVCGEDVEFVEGVWRDDVPNECFINTEEYSCGCLDLINSIQYHEDHTAVDWDILNELTGHGCFHNESCGTCIIRQPSGEVCQLEDDVCPEGCHECWDGCFYVCGEVRSICCITEQECAAEDHSTFDPSGWNCSDVCCDAFE